VSRRFDDRLRLRFPIAYAADPIAAARSRPYRLGMPESDTGERVVPVLDFPWRDGLAVQAVRVDYAPGGFSGVHRHPAGAYVYVIDGSVLFGVDGDEPVRLKAGDSFYEPPGALHTVSRNASDDVPASFIAFFVLGEGEDPTVEAA
jgi:quercetin dioxygenase-like cupin family protein